MTTITQTPEPIGPVPRCVRMDDGDGIQPLLIITMAFTVLAHAMIYKENKKSREDFLKRFGKHF